MKLDMKQRHTLARMDDKNRREKVDLARDMIYNRNFVVNSKHVEALLKEESLVPTAVSAKQYHLSLPNLTAYVEF
jgi:hypothetical protein